MSRGGGERGEVRHRSRKVAVNRSSLGKKNATMSHARSLCLLISFIDIVIGTMLERMDVVVVYYHSV
jgi:hypothetical protein